MSFVPINRRAGREIRRRGASAVAQSTAAGVPGQELTTSAQHSNLFIVVPGKPQALGGGGCGASATMRLGCPCTHHFIYSVPATGSIGLALIIHSLSGPNFAPFFFRNLGRESGGELGRGRGGWEDGRGGAKRSRVNTFSARAERSGTSGGSRGWGGDVWPLGGGKKKKKKLQNKAAAVSVRL